MKDEVPRTATTAMRGIYLTWLVYMHGRPLATYDPSASKGVYLDLGLL